MAPSTDQKPILGTRQTLPDTFPYVRAWGVAALSIILYMAAAISITPLVSQYVVKRLGDSSMFPNVTNSTANISNHCNGSIPGVQQQAIQKEASKLVLYYSLLGSCPAIVINIFMGPMSDFIGRRVVFAFPLVGIVIKTTIIAIIVKLDLDLNLMYLAYGIDGLCGSYYAIFVAVFSYTADITVPGNTRTVAIAIMEGCLACAASTGVLVSGFLIRSTGFFYPVLMLALLAFVALIIVYFLLPETITEKKRANKSPLYNLRMVFGFYFTDGTLYKRCVYSVLMATFFFGVITILGRSSLETIYQLGEPFCWDSVNIGIYGCLRIGAQFICSILAIKLLQYYIDDEIISIISSVFALGGFVLEALAVNGTMMYLVPVVGVFGAASVPIARSLMSKMTPSNKQGAMFASIAIIETVCNSTSYSLYNLVYDATVENYQGAVWFMMAGLCVVDIGFLLIYICLSRSKGRDFYSTAAENLSVNRNDCGSTDIF